MIRHILLIKFKQHCTENDVANIKQLFLAMPSKIKGVLSVEWGFNDSPENKNQGYDYSVLMTFTDDAARQRYLPHPDHEALKTQFAPLLDDIIVFDYSV